VSFFVVRGKLKSLKKFGLKNWPTARPPQEEPPMAEKHSDRYGYERYIQMGLYSSPPFPVDALRPTSSRLQRSRSNRGIAGIYLDPHHPFANQEE
jgi:hypothetical protein